MESQISHYRIGRLLGRGGMGEVYEAEDLDLGRRVALKFISAELAADPQNLKRFENEARAAASLNHPSIATLYAFERTDGRSFIAMELVPGESLRTRLRSGVLPLAEALHVAHDVAAALAQAHRRGLVHRDIKPENLMFGEDGRIRVMDFGLARAIEASRLTMTGSAVGTAAYMAPESVRGESVPASDVFALGIVLHEMLAGDLPFAGDSAMALMFTITHEPPRPLRERRPGVPESLASLIERILVKDPAARPDAATVANEIAAIAAGPLPADADAGIENLYTPAMTSDALTSAHTVVSAPPRAGAAPWRPTPVEPSTPRGLERRPMTEELEIERRLGGDRAPGPGGALVPTARREGQGALRRVIWLVMAAAVVIVVVTRELDARRHHADEAVMLNNLGHSAFLADSLPRAQTLFTMALDRAPDFAPALINMGQLYRRRSQPDSAALMFRRVVERSGRDPASAALANYGLAQIDLQSGALDGAAAHLEKSLALDSTRVEYYNDLGWALAANLGRGPEAQHVLELGLKRFPDSPPLKKNLALTLARRGETERARGMVDEVTRASPTYASAWGLKAVLEGRLGDHAAEARDWATYTSLAPDTAEARAYQRERAVAAIATH